MRKPVLKLDLIGGFVLKILDTEVVRDNRRHINKGCWERFSIVPSFIQVNVSYRETKFF